MLFYRMLGVLLMSGEPGAGGGGGGPAPVPDPAPQQQDDPEIKLTTKQLNARLERSRSSALKEVWGTDNVDEIRAKQTRLKELEDQEEATKRAQMTEIERHKADAAAAKAAQAAAEEQLAEVRFAGIVSDNCAKLGITNLNYAKYLAASRADALPEGQQLDVEQFLKEQLDDPQVKAALGLSAPVKVIDKPVDTSPAGGKPPAPPPPAGGVPAGGKAVKDMTQSEFQAHLASLK
jgi:hypothetical protein